MHFWITHLKIKTLLAVVFFSSCSFFSLFENYTHEQESPLRVNPCADLSIFYGTRKDLRAAVDSNPVDVTEINVSSPPEVFPRVFEAAAEALSSACTFRVSSFTFVFFSLFGVAVVVVVVGGGGGGGGGGVGVVVSVVVVVVIIVIVVVIVVVVVVIIVIVVVVVAAAAAATLCVRYLNKTVI